MTTPRAPGPDRQAGESGEAYDDGRLRVEHDNYYVTCDGRLLSLPRKEFLILSRLAQSAGRIVPSDALLRYVWGERAGTPPASLHVHIYRLRRRLRPHGVRVETMINVGYRLLPPPRSAAGCAQQLGPHDRRARSLPPAVKTREV